ncbi:hypothetical protein CK203_053404 [Vitis vinifera]|uniref:Uncharacterized protein n=1 Tax=Vitis vinifera TaxID=29760 RepID=A0A438GZK9_VITVI|nr:hypothetical protein CK203_053404 [Vitis vinifera]
MPVPTDGPSIITPPAHHGTKLATNPPTLFPSRCKVLPPQSPFWCRKPPTPPRQSKRSSSKPDCVCLLTPPSNCKGIWQKVKKRFKKCKVLW